MTDFERGLMTAAARARHLASEEAVTANQIEARRSYNSRDHDSMRRHRSQAALYADFAAWCEREAGTYIGASRVLIGL